MTLDQFKEKLFKKANEMSVEMAYNGFTYRIAYSIPEVTISATANFLLDNKELNYINLGVTDLNDKCFSTIYIPYFDEPDKIQDFLDKVEENGYFDL